MLQEQRQKLQKEVEELQGKVAAPAAQPAQPLEAPALEAPSSKLPMGAPSVDVVNGWMMLHDAG